MAYTIDQNQFYFSFLCDKKVGSPIFNFGIFNLLFACMKPFSFSESNFALKVGYSDLQITFLKISKVTKNNNFSRFHI
jgi:hypothetical protein